MSSRLRYIGNDSVSKPQATANQLQLTTSNCARKKRINNKNPNLYGKHYSIVGRNYERLELWAGSRRRRGRRGILLLHEDEEGDKSN